MAGNRRTWPGPLLYDLEVHGLGALALRIRQGLKIDSLALGERRQTGALNRADMHENIRASTIRGHEAEATGGIEELHRAHLRFAERRTWTTIPAATAAFGARAIGAVAAATATITATFGAWAIGAIPATTTAITTTFRARSIGAIATAIAAAFGARPIGAIPAAAKSTFTWGARATRPAKSAATSAATARGPKAAAAKARGGGLGPEIGLTLAACAALFFSSVFGIVVEFVVEAHETLLTPGETIPPGQ